MAAPEKFAAIVKSRAKELGFEHCGIAEATFLEEEASKLEEWLKRDYHGKMSYMGNHFDKRLDPRKLVEGAKSVVSLIYNYFPSENMPMARITIL
jgi:epoxyqueuosine reductase